MSTLSITQHHPGVTLQSSLLMITDVIYIDTSVAVFSRKLCSSTYIYLVIISGEMITY